MKNCKLIQEKLFFFLEDELDAKEHSSVKEHLAKCSRCAEYLSGFESSKRLLTELPQLNAPSRIWSSLQRKIREEKPARKVRLAPVFQLKYFIPTASAAAAVVMALLFLFPLHTSPTLEYNIVNYSTMTPAEKSLCDKAIYKPLFAIFSSKSVPSHLEKGIGFEKDKKQ